MLTCNYQPQLQGLPRPWVRMRRSRSGRCLCRAWCLRLCHGTHAICLQLLSHVVAARTTTALCTCKSYRHGLLYQGYQVAWIKCKKMFHIRGRLPVSLWYIAWLMRYVACLARVSTQSWTPLFGVWQGEDSSADQQEKTDTVLVPR